MSFARGIFLFVTLFASLATSAEQSLIQTGGFEHIVSVIQVDWIADGGGSDVSPVVVASAVAETGSWRLDDPHIVQRGGVWKVGVSGTETHMTPVIHGRWIISLGRPGMLTALLMSEDMDRFIKKAK